MARCGRYMRLLPGIFSTISSPGASIGLWTLFLGFGSIISPIFAGWVIDISGRFSWAFILSSGASGLSVLVLLPAFAYATH